jgi:hypothetical protein
MKIRKKISIIHMVVKQVGIYVPEKEGKQKEERITYPYACTYISYNIL